MKLRTIHELVVEGTDREIENEALRRYAIICDGYAHNSVFNAQSREAYRKMAGKVRAILELRAEDHA